LLYKYFQDGKEGLSVYNYGFSGNTSKDLLLRFEVETIARKPDVIIFAIGINGYHSKFQIYNQKIKEVC